MILKSPQNRIELVTRPDELQAFYIQRKAEMSASDSSGGSGRLALVPSEAGEITEKDVEAAIRCRFSKKIHTHAEFEH